MTDDPSSTYDPLDVELGRVVRRLRSLTPAGWSPRGVRAVTDFLDAVLVPSLIHPDEAARLLMTSIESRTPAGAAAVVAAVTHDLVTDDRAREAEVTAAMVVLRRSL